MTKEPTRAEVLDAAAGKLLDRIISKGEYEWSDRPAFIKELADAVVKNHTPKLEKAIDSQISTVISNHFEGLLFKTNSWGDKTGERVGMTDLILDRINKWLEAKVDPKNGKPESYSTSIPRYQYLVRELPCQDLEKRINEKINQIRDVALNEVTATVSEILTKKIAARGGI